MVIRATRGGRWFRVIEMKVLEELHAILLRSHIVLGGRPEAEVTWVMAVSSSCTCSLNLSGVE